jgi:hypothetical protein
MLHPGVVLAQVGASCHAAGKADALTFHGSSQRVHPWCQGASMPLLPACPLGGEGG